MSDLRDSLVDRALERLDGLISLRRRQFCKDHSFRGMSFAQIHILMALQERGRTTVSELGQMLQVSTPSASSILDRMEDNGLVRRVRDVADRRVVHVEVSDRGCEVVEEFVGVKREEMRMLFEAMTADELHHMTYALEAFGRVMEQASETSGEGAA